MRYLLLVLVPSLLFGGVSIDRITYDIDGCADITRMSSATHYLYAGTWDAVKASLPTVARKYWKNTGGAYPVEMDAAEKKAVDDAEREAADAAAQAAADISSIDPPVYEALKKIQQQINELQIAAGITAITPAQLRQYVIYQLTGQ